MTDLATLAQADLNACFDLFERSAERLETLAAYSVGGSEAERLMAFRLGLPRPERSVRTSPWLARIAETTVAGKAWRRVRVMDWPPGEYQRYQMVGYQESAAAGDVIRIADRTAHPGLATLKHDFWLFDADGPQPFAALMGYNRDGEYLGSEITAVSADVERCRAELALATRYSIPLHTYLARLRSAAA